MDNMTKEAWKKAPQAEPSINLAIKRIQRFSESRIVNPEITVRMIPSSMNVKLPNLSARIQKGSIVPRAPRK